MYVRPVKRICDVRGCNNKDCFSISRVRETGNTPVICKSCLGIALSALDEPTVVQAQKKKPIPKLFYNSVAFPEAPVEEENEQNAEGEVQTDEPSTDAITEQKEEEGAEVVPDENVENLAAPSEAPVEEEKPKTRRRATKKGDK